MMNYGAKFNAQSVCTYKDLKSSPPKLEQSYVDHPNIKYIFNDKHPECNACVPTIDDLLTIHPYANTFGRFNEIEYSANIKFKNVIIDKTNGGVLEKERFYFKDSFKLFYNKYQVSTIYFDGSNQMDGNIFTRFDYIPGSKTIELVTTKLKVLKTKFNYFDVTYSLTGAIEIEFPELKSAMKNRPQPTSFNRRRTFIYWNIALTVDNEFYIFRVAFRQLKNTNNYECNIECEDAISGCNFIICFDLLSKYYKYQYLHQNGTIRPLMDELNVNAMRLTSIQRKIIHTIRLIPCPDQKLPEIPCFDVEDEVKKFIKFLSLKTVRQHIDNLDLPINMYASIIYNDGQNYISDDVEEFENNDMF